ncbi:hypothetical protein [Rickettsia endosymbiont of Orchestes rusci]|uniref:hypothetical protein n=1 Tax=Rickettsia endosymbiont of Orchestes rusci TaxID=3066250 RepID=UPI00313D118D
MSFLGQHLAALLYDSILPRHCEEGRALLHGSKKVPYVILAKGWNLEKSIKVIPNLFQDILKKMRKTCSA